MCVCGVRQWGELRPQYTMILECHCAPSEPEYFINPGGNYSDTVVPDFLFFNSHTKKFFFELMFYVFFSVIGE